MEQELLFEKFRINSCLKKDSFSSVYLADHIYLEKKIILKTLDTLILPDNSILERFKREAKILAGLDHPNIIKVLDFGMYKNFFYISFEFFNSKNLRQIIKDNNLTIDQKTSLFIQIIKGLNAAHKKHIVHRDIKPENILVNSELELRIADFGLAMILNENVVTNQYSIVGTPGYMSPEQIQGEILSCQSDLFSAGIVYYELLTKENPFLGRDINETINNILNFTDEIFTKLQNIPDEHIHVLKMLLNKNLQQRFKTSAEVLLSLNVEDTNGTQPSGNSSSKRIRIIYLLSGAIVIIILLWVGFRIFDTNKPPNEPKIFISDETKTQPTEEVSLKEKQPFEKNQIEKSESNDIIPDNKKEPLTTKDEVNVSEKKVLSLVKGELYVDSNPWAEVYIDSQKVDVTPLKISLLPGEHTLVLIHQDYPPYSKKIVIQPGFLSELKVKLDTIVGYLDCMIHPWGDIFINGELKGQTPLNKPIPLSPGSYTLTIKNPNFANYVSFMTITKNDTFKFKLNLETIK